MSTLKGIIKKDLVICGMWGVVEKLVKLAGELLKEGRGWTLKIDLYEIWSKFEVGSDEDDFNFTMTELYDWGDSNSVWIGTSI